MSKPDWTKRQWSLFVLACVGLGVLWGVVFPGDFIAGLVDAAWWRLLPWALLALLWLAFGIRAWRRRRKTDEA